MSTNISAPSISGLEHRNAIRRSNAPNLLPINACVKLLILIVLSAFVTAAHAQSYYYVDCSGANPADYSTISAALAVAGPNSFVIVSGTCNENVSISNVSNLNLGAPYGATATINGNVRVTASNTVFLYGLNVTNTAGDAFDITSSHNVTLWACTANGNAGTGLTVQTLSDATVLGPASFDNNSSSGISVNQNSILILMASGGSADISRNHGAGVMTNDGALFATLGNTTITNNINVPGGSRPDGFGIQELSASKVQIANCYGTNQISGNESGGVDVRESSRLSIWNCSTVGANILENNGPVGINAGLGSEVALYTNVEITGHSGPGVELYAQGQLYMYGPNLIANNGNTSDPHSAGILADGNSEAFLRGGTISTNRGPGILALVNSSVDSVGATFSGNTGGIATCDSSAYMVSDLLPASGATPPGIACRTPHHLGNRHDFSAAPIAPDVTVPVANAAKYKKFASPKK